MDQAPAIADVKDDIPDFSKLGTTIVTEKLEPRPISKDGKDKSRYVEEGDDTVNELDFNYELDPATYPFSNIESAQELLSGILYHEHLDKNANFRPKTNIECLYVRNSGAEWRHLDDSSLRALVDEASARWNNVPALSTSVIPGDPTPSRQALVFFAPLHATPDTSFQWATSISRSCVKHLFESLNLNHAFLPNMLGRPDYWAPQTLWNEEENDLRGCDFYCQYPRWNLTVQGAPLSVYCKYDVQRDLTVYIVSYKANDTVIRSLQNLLNITVRHQAQSHIADLLMESPLDLHAWIAHLNFEASKWHVKRFQRLQWEVVNKVDDHLAGIEDPNRLKLAELLKKLQIVAQNVDSHLANAEVFLYSAKAICDACMRLKVMSSKCGRVRERSLDMIRHVITCMEKQEMWFLNYKARKDATMNLIFHITTQQDALNNIEIASDMKKDSTSMAAIAGLTMVFLPGTFTASMFSTSIFESKPGATASVTVTGLWWLWLATTIPITAVTVFCWWWYSNREARKSQPIRLWFRDKEKEVVASED